MKTVQEVLRELDTEKLLETYVNNHPIEFYELKTLNLLTCEVYERYKEEYRQYLERLRTIEIAPEKDSRRSILFVSRCINDDYTSNEYNLVYLDELLEKGVECERYGFMFTTQAEIMGFLVADTPLTQENIYELMVYVMNEAAFFGFEQEWLAEELDSLNKSMEQIGEASSHPFDEIAKELGWTRHVVSLDENSEEVALRLKVTEAKITYRDYSRKEELQRIMQMLI